MISILATRGIVLANLEHYHFPRLWKKGATTSRRIPFGKGAAGVGFIWKKWISDAEKSGGRSGGDG
jgi:hypothetical protein